MSTATRQKLSRARWIEAGYQALTQSGPDALKAEPLARGLGTTKGSFYWHFQDVPEYHSALLADWVARARPVSTDDGPAVPSLRAMAEALGHPNDTERALRSWAGHHAGAREALSRIDQERLAHIAGLLSEIGIDNPEIARLILATAIGMCDLGDSNGASGTEAMGTLVDLILAMR